jgi:hypothetical protein
LKNNQFSLSLKIIIQKWQNTIAYAQI